MTEKEFMQEGINLNWLVLLFFKKIWFVILAAVAGAIVFGGGYFGKHVLWGPAKEYEALSRYYIEFAQDKAKDYYNAYTWNEFMSSDPILGYTMTLLPKDWNKQFVQNSIVAKIEADVRVLTTTVTTNDPAKTLLIAQATQQSLVHFAEELTEIREIRVIKEAETKQVIVDSYTVRATVYGAVGAAALATILLAFSIAMDSSVYLPEDFEKRYAYPVLGTVMKEKQGKNIQQLLDNLTYICKEGSYALLPVGKDSKESKESLNSLQEICDLCNQHSHWEGTITACGNCLEKETNYEELRGKAGIILSIKYGNKDGPLVQKAIEQLKKQNGHIVGAIIYHADEKMLKWYHR